MQADPLQSRASTGNSTDFCRNSPVFLYRSLVPRPRLASFPGLPRFLFFGLRFSIIHGSGTEHKPKNKKRGRPGNEARRRSRSVLSSLGTRLSRHAVAWKRLCWHASQAPGQSWSTWRDGEQVWSYWHRYQWETGIAPLGSDFY